MHLVGAAHLAARRLQNTAARVFEMVAGSQERLLTDDARTAHLFDLAVRVGDDPVPRSELRAFDALVRDANRICKYIAMGTRRGLLRHVHGANRYADALSDRIGHAEGASVHGNLVQDDRGVAAAQGDENGDALADSSPRSGRIESSGRAG
jgi:hypothetical protein